MIHMFQLDSDYDTSIYSQMKATHRKVIGLAARAASGIWRRTYRALRLKWRARRHSANDRPVDDKAARRRLARLRSRQRHALAELDDRLLRDIGVIRERDIGVSREEARREIEPLWLS